MVWLAGGPVAQVQVTDNNQHGPGPWRAQRRRARRLLAHWHLSAPGRTGHEDSRAAGERGGLSAAGVQGQASCPCHPLRYGGARPPVAGFWVGGENDGMWGRLTWRGA